MNAQEYPLKPNFIPLTDANRRMIFGSFNFRVNADNSIQILGNWVNEHIVTIKVPELVGVPTYNNKKHNGTVICHRMAKDPLLKLFKAWADAKLMEWVIFWGGCYVPRMVRGTNNQLSNHSWGTAFDINTQANPMGAYPPAIGKPGCVRELVPIANDLGWYWGGHFKRRDGMHFELSKI